MLNMKKLFCLLLICCAWFPCKAHKVNGHKGERYVNGKQVGLHSEKREERRIEAKAKQDIFDINKKIKSQFLIDGDIVSLLEPRNTVRDTAEQWPSTTIPFVYSSSAHLEAIGSIELARQEYKLRTCLDFVERTDESNYISFGSYDGCYSSVGMVGGSQTISIGYGCERMATVCHEMMHAIGIWHEQSRADRNDYVKIDYENIEEGHEYNFDYYNWSITDARRIPYDFDSIMHYSDTSFSTNGQPTITTINPAFQDVIGQRLTFSRGDSTKINRMYNCSDTLLYSYNCNFEIESVCGYAQDYENDDVDWFRYVIRDRDVTVSPNVPTFDATSGKPQIGSYMLVDTTQKAPKIAQMKSMRLLSKSNVQCLQFSYYLDRNVNSTAAMAVHIGYIDGSSGAITTLSEPLVTIDYDSENIWRTERMTIQAPPAYTIVFRTKTDIYADDVIAVDDVSVQDKPCETSYFVVTNYSSVLQSIARGHNFLSPVMYTEEGYAFRVKIYPNGASNSYSNDMSMYFGLVQGPHDDNLVWPFCNKYVRLMVVDQNNNPLYALNKYSEFLTTQSAGGDIWNKPTSSNSAGYYGYSNFMSLKDLTETHNYLKHDSLMVSVLIKDMNWVHDEVCSGEFTRTEKEKEESKGQEYRIDLLYGDYYQNNSAEDHIDMIDGKEVQHQEDLSVPVGVAAAFALGSSFFVLVVMSVVLCCVTSAFRTRLGMISNNLAVLPKNASPFTYPSPSFESTQKV